MRPALILLTAAIFCHQAAASGDEASPVSGDLTTHEHLALHEAFERVYGGTQQNDTLVKSIIADSRSKHQKVRRKHMRARKKPTLP